MSQLIQKSGNSGANPSQREGSSKDSSFQAIYKKESLDENLPKEEKY